jgi:hypothetical protein
MKNQRQKKKSRVPAATRSKSLVERYQEVLRLREAVQKAEKASPKRSR